MPADAQSECQAWCAECELARIADEGWYDKADAVAQWDMVCGSCYQALTEQIRDVTQYDVVETPERT